MTQANDRVTRTPSRPHRKMRSANALLATSCVLTLLCLVPTTARAAPAPATPGEDVQPTASPAPVLDNSAAPTAAPAIADSPNPTRVPPPQIDAKLSLRGAAIWDGLEGQRVVLGLADASSVKGTVVTHSASEVALARDSDGLVVSVPKAEVQTVNMRAQAGSNGRPGVGAAGTLPRDSGRKLHSGGVVLLSIGSPFALAGIVMLGVCPGCLYIHLPLLLPGTAMIIGGAVALKRAKKRNIAFRKAWGIPLAGRMQLTPTLGVGRSGGEVGFTLRF